MGALAPAQLVPLLEAWLPGQRWFAGKGRPFQIEASRQLGTLTDEPYPTAIWLITLRYANRTVETYQVPLVRRAAPSDTLHHVLVGETPDPDTGEPVWWYDALHDKAVTGAWLRHLQDDATLDGPDGERLTFRRGPGVDDLPLAEHSLVLTAEQSNTSLVYGDAAILKVFRKIEPGVNPDVEVHEALALVPGGERHVARLLGDVAGRWPLRPDAEAAPAEVPAEGSVAILQGFLRTGTDGWELAKPSVRDLFAEADLHANEVGGDFAGEAHRLGQATAELHDDLARALPTATLGRNGLVKMAEAMRVRLDSAMEAVPELAAFAPALRAAYDALAARTAEVPVQRIHGDYHLGQVLRTSRRWVVLDFEGEPARPLAERVALDSPLRDVAGMLRSFDYAARHMLADHAGDPQLAYRAEEWAERNRSAFCDGYAEGSGRDPREQTVLLRAYEADKAVYEAVYEARNRPTWLHIPLGSLGRLTQGVP
jgi:maltokinase